MILRWWNRRKARLLLNSAANYLWVHERLYIPQAYWEARHILIEAQKRVLNQVP